MLRQLFFIFIVTLIITVAAQSNKRTFSGFVFSEESSKALPGATILVPGTNTGTYSSSRGFFRLKIPAGTKKIKISARELRTLKKNS